MKIFFIGADIPYPGFTGGSVVSWSVINYLISKNHEISIFSDFPRYGINEISKNLREKMINNIKNINCTFYSLKHLEIKISKKNKLQKFFSNKLEDYYPEYYSSKIIEDFIKKKFQELKPDLILCYGSAAIYFVRNLNVKNRMVWSSKSILIQLEV